ncbi:hypothetical protein KBD08_03520 [Candidatus Babeliales bacterium]|nr:hypothetical protein [Candidatus Babeliales bacterium]
MKVKFLLVAAIVCNGAIFADDAVKSFSWWGLKPTPAVKSTAAVKASDVVKAPEVATPAQTAPTRMQKVVTTVKSAGKSTYATLAAHPRIVTAIVVACAAASAVYAYSEEIFAQEEA